MAFCLFLLVVVVFIPACLTKSVVPTTGATAKGGFILLEDEDVMRQQERRVLAEEEGTEPPPITPHHSKKTVPFFPAFPGALSAFSSLLIMYVILHSRNKLSSVYHRIMFFMSTADIFSSLAMAFQTIPMPRNLPREDEFPEYVFATKRLGNTTTCNIQGFAYLFGVIGLFNYNSMLSVYYGCAIGLQMDEKRISRTVEPVFHFIVIGLALLYSIPPLLTELYNPSPTEMWCVPSPYPYDCKTNEDVECIRGNINSPFAFDIVWGLAIGIGLNFLFVIVSFSIVIARVIHMDRSVERYSKTSCSENMRKKLDSVRANNRVTKVVVVQVSAYILAFVVTLMFPFFNFVTDESPLVTQALTLVFLPLQGFFNLLIFMGHKVYNYRRVNPGVSRCEALRTFFFSANVEEPMYISQLSRVEKHDESNYDDGQDDEEDYESYQDDGPPTSPKSMHRDASEGDAVFFDENESKSSMSWMANDDEDGLFSYGPSSVGRSSGMSETSRSKSTRGENDQSNSGSTKDKQSSSKSYLSYSIE
jgi:hypothetical protein